MNSIDEVDRFRSKLRLLVIPVIVVLLVILPFLMFGEEFEARAIQLAEDQEQWGLSAMGAALLAIDVVLPIPSSILSILLGARLGFVSGAAVVTVGLTLGSCVGYMLGRISSRLVGKAKEQADGIARLGSIRFGILSVALFRPVPVLAETSSILAGHYQMPFGAFFLVSFLANIAVGVTYALIGSALSPNLAYLVGIILVALVIALCAKLLMGGVSALFTTNSN